MPPVVPQSVRKALGAQAADDFTGWLDENYQQRAVARDEFREVLSRLDVLESEVEARFDHVDERFDHMEKRFDERFDERFEKVDRRFDEVDKRFDKVDRRFEQVTEQLDRMNGRTLSMTRWLIGLLVVFGTMVTVLLAIAQFTTG
jgi:tetrahydromethanopterin S-methyltransferase subunit G